MQLKKLQLVGFKTFADRTEIQIDSGMTAIVGPNGSGKSNIVDALLWVLGEQNPRLLRGSSAQDVIFAGTDKRRPLGMAEVKLTIDNSDGSLPINFTEITITRRVFRSGESQYLLNNAVCRLKDILELLLDTGAGKGAYAFVSQNEIDAVLSARAEDRRELFEEAAGIKKYRVKKREAMRKLENAETNLTRVRDIIQELDAQRGPMERQAQEARRYLLLQERLASIEVGLLVAELQKADYELFAARQAQEEDRTSLFKLDADLARLEHAADTAGEQLASAESELDAIGLSRQNAHTSMERARSQLSLLAERGKTSRQRQEQLATEIEGIETRIRQLNNLLTADQSELEACEKDESARREDWGAHKAALEELNAACMQTLREQERRQTERMRQEKERAGLEARFAGLVSRVEEFEQRQERLKQDLLRQSELLETAKKRQTEAAENAETLRVSRAELKAKREALETRLAQTREKQAGSRSDLDSARRLLAEQSSRLTTLTELQESHEGFYQGVRAVLGAARKGQITGTYKALVDLLTVPEPYRVAIEVALGGSLQDIVTKTEQEAKAGIEWLKRTRSGRATFLPLPLLRPGPRCAVPPESRRSPDDCTGIHNASEIVQCLPEYSAVLQLLLGRTLVVPDMDTAIACSRRISGWGKIVTLEGELLTPGGALTGGSLQGKGAHLVGRKGEIDDLRARLPMTRSSVDTLTGSLEQETIALREADQAREECLRVDSKLLSELTAAEGLASAGMRECERLERERRERETTLKSIQDQHAKLSLESDELRNRITADTQESVTSDDALNTLNAESRQLIERRDACRARAVGLEVEVSRLRERRDGLVRSLASARAELKSQEIQRNQKRESRLSVAAEGETAVADQAQMETRLAETQTQLNRIEADFTRWKDQRQLLLTKSFEINNSLKETTRKRAELTESLHKAELALARLEVQVSQVTERLQTEYAISKEDALAMPEDATIDKNTAMEVNRLRREIRAMGAVNTGAVEEFDRLTERSGFLVEQQADLEKGRGSLLTTISEIDESTRGVFMETFEAVSKEFDRLFQRLFGGGSTRLTLTDPEDLLETGIDVLAQPPGKKAQNLSLLSGGERALTATALLFAFLAVRPSPFVLLDEVDAPLDGANVEKFTRLVKEFSERSQFLIITHNPVTMEHAPTWYGVTMREPGVSSILSYRVPQEAVETEEDAAVVLSN